MNPDSARSHDLLQRLGTAMVPVDEPAAVDARRHKVVGHLGAVMRREARRNARLRAFRPAMFAALLAAAALALVVGWKLVRGRPEQHVADRMIALAGDVAVVRQGQTIASGQVAAELRSDDEVRTASDGQAWLSLAQGTVVTVFPSAQIRFVASAPQGAAIDLAIGRVQVQVPKLGQAASFSVLTPHAQVIVHGTRFEVEVKARGVDGIAPTTVRVTDGLVAVRTVDRQIMLEAGAVWSNEPQAGALPQQVSPPAAESDPAADSAPANAVAGAPPIARAATSAPGAARPAGPGSTLSEENRLFRSAMDARRRGDDAEAIRQLDALLASYPRSALAQEARVERFRCLRRLGQDAAAASEARRYLAEHPDGFAREEARGIVLPPTPSPSPKR